MIDTNITPIPYSSNLKVLIDSIKDVKTLTSIPIIDNDYYIIADVCVTNIKNYLTALYELETLNISQAAKQDIAREITHPNGEGVVFDISEQAKSEVENFWNSSVDFQSPVLHLNFAPLSVPEFTSLAKVHYLFLMLGLMQVYVTRAGQILGVISYEFFAKGIR